MINWLEILKPNQQIKHLSNHYILRNQNKFMVFTSKPIGKSHLISTTNIEGKFKNQYLVEQVHEIDPTNYIIKETEKGAIFYAEHKESLQLYVKKIIEIQ